MCRGNVADAAADANYDGNGAGFFGLVMAT